MPMIKLQSSDGEVRGLLIRQIEEGSKLFIYFVLSTVLIFYTYNWISLQKRMKAKKKLK